MLSSRERLRARQGLYAPPRHEYLQQLVDEYQRTPQMLRKEEIVANLANFAYDPINYGSIHRLQILELFLDILDADQEDEEDHDNSEEEAPKKTKVKAGGLADEKYHLVEFALGGISNCIADPVLQQQFITSEGIPLVVSYIMDVNVEKGIPLINKKYTSELNKTISAITIAYFLLDSSAFMAITEERIVAQMQTLETHPNVEIANVAAVFRSRNIQQQKGSSFKSGRQVEQMRLSICASLLSASLLLLQHTILYTSSCEASAVTAGSPEHLVAKGGECVRLFHSSGDIGCRSLTNADMAKFYPITSTDELTAFLNGDADSQEADEKYVLVLSEQLFIDTEAILAGVDHIAGVFAYPNDSHNISFASTTPQGDGTVDGALNPFASKKIAWNLNGSGLIEHSLPFPVVLLKDAETGAEFLKRAQTNIKDGAGATYKAFMKYYFGPEEMNSLKCLSFTNIYGNRSPKCDPIGGQSAWGLRGNLDSSEIVLATAGMDATGLSHVLTPGANTAASGLVALLTAAEALKAIPDSSFDKKVVFAAFQGEKYGFVGSRKFLSDLQTFTENPDTCAYPVSDSVSPYGSSFCTNPMISSTEFATQLRLANISYAIAVDQVGILPTSGNFSVHMNPNAASKGSATLMDTILNSPSGSNFAAGSVDALPPSPLLAFVNADEYGQEDLVAAVIAGYDSEFSGTGVFNSRHDVYEALDIDAVAQASQVLAETIFQLASTNASSEQLDKIKVDKELVQDMLSCVVNDWRCELMNNYSSIAVATMVEYLDLVDTAWPSYASPTTLYCGPVSTDRVMLVKTSDSTYHAMYNSTWSESDNRVKLFPNAYEVFTRAFLASAMIDSATADDDSVTTCTKNQDCDGTGKECIYPGVCASQRGFFHEAISPGLQRTNTIGTYDVVNSSMPIWTEPEWDSDIRSYSFPDPGVWIGWITLVIGIVVSIVGFFLSKMILSSVNKMKLL